MDLIDTLVIGAGQSGLATAHALRKQGIDPVVLEAGDAPTGAWPKYYESLTLFSPARYSALPGLAFPGDPDRYPHRDEVVAYLEEYAKRLDVDIRIGHYVRDLKHANEIFTARLADGRELHARTVVAATGGFTNPYRPALPGLASFTGTVLHAADYQRPEPFAGQRVLVVGGGNSAIQIAAELAEHARATVTTREKLRFAPQRPLGRDLHFWYTVTGLDTAPVGRLLTHPPTVPVLDTGRYRTAIATGRPDHRPMFTALEGRPGALERRRQRAGRRPHPRHRLPARPRLPHRTRRPRQARTPSASGRARHRPTWPGVRRPRMAAQPLLGQHPRRRA